MNQKLLGFLFIFIFLAGPALALELNPNVVENTKVVGVNIIPFVPASGGGGGGGNVTNATLDIYNATMKAYVDFHDLSFNSTLKAYVDFQDALINSSMKLYVDAQNILFNNSLVAYIASENTLFNNSLKAYVDSQDLAFNSSMQSYVVSVNGTMKTYVDSQDGVYNASMKTYVDAQDVTFNSSMKTYVDAQDVTFNSSMQSYVVSTNTSMKGYVDSQDGVYNASMKTYTDATFRTIGNQSFVGDLNITDGAFTINDSNKNSFRVSVETYGFGLKYPTIFMDGQNGASPLGVMNNLNIIDHEGKGDALLQFAPWDLSHIWSMTMSNSTGNLTLDDGGNNDLIITESTFLEKDVNVTGELRFSTSSAFDAVLEYDSPSIGDMLYYNTTSSSWQKSLGSAVDGQSLTYCTKGGVQWISVIGGAVCPI